MIVDASVAFKWLADEDDSDLALALLARSELLAPNFLLVEIANALWKKVMKQEIDAAVSFTPEIERIGELVTLVDATMLVGRALEIARALSHPISDCLYLALAESREMAVVTADLRFLAKLPGTAMANLIVPLRDAVQL